MNPATRHFLKALQWGTLVGGGFFLVLTVPLGVAATFDGHLAEGLFLAVLPLLISGAGTLAGLLIVGLPLTAFLARRGRESASSYTLVGGLAGFLMPGIVVAMFEPALEAFLPVGLFLGLFGFIAGLTAASEWGAWREAATTEPTGAPDIDSRKWLL